MPTPRQHSEPIQQNPAAILRLQLNRYAAAFAASATATTLIDAEGIIVDLNDAFLALARQYTSTICREDRIGYHILDFVREGEEDHRRAFGDLLDRLLKLGLSGSFVRESEDPDGRPLRVEIKGSPLFDAEGQITGATIRRENVTQDLQQQRRQTAIALVREQVWSMGDSSEAEHLLVAVRDGLRFCGVPFVYCGVNLVEVADRSVSSQVVAHGIHIEAEEVYSTPPIGDTANQIISDIWRSEEMDYRNNLDECDVHDEKKSLGNMRCVLDMPFSHGTLAVSSPHPDAFSRADIEIIRQMAQVLSEGFQRLQDLKAQELHARHTAALADAIAIVASTDQLGEVFDVVVRQAAQLTDSSRAVLFLYEEAEEMLVPRAQIGHDEAIYRQIRLRPGESLSGQVFATGRALIIDRHNEGIRKNIRPQTLDLWQRAVGDGDRLMTSAAVPLLIDGQAIGALSVGADQYRYGQRDIDMLERLAEQVALAIDRDRQKRELVRQHQLREAENAVRLKIASMDEPKDLLGVAEAISRQLLILDVQHDGSSIQIVHADGDDFVSVALNLARPDTWQIPAEALGGLRWQHKTDNAKLFPWVLEVWRSGQPHHTDHTEEIEDLKAGLALVDVPFSHGTLAVNRRELGAFSQADIALIERFAAILSEGFQRFLYLIESEQATRNTEINLVLQRIRNEVLQMQTEADWQHIAQLFYEKLQKFVPCYRAGIVLVDAARQSYIDYRLTEEGTQLLHYDSVAKHLLRAMDENIPVYQRRRSEFGSLEERIPAEVQSIVDVPFRGGTVSMNSTREEAFSARDIAVLEQFAQVLSEAHRRLEDLEKMRQQESQLHQSQKMETIGQLAGGVAHDFNNLLTAILGGGEQLLHDAADDDPHRAEMELIVEAGNRAADLTQQLLAFSRRQVLRPQIIDLNTIIEHQTEIVRRLIGENIQLITALKSDLCSVEADASQIEQILLNLIVNARDAMPTGGVLRIATANIMLDEPFAAHNPGANTGPHARITISDTGTGIDPDILEHIFEPFFTTKPKDKGTGLGLSTVYGIVAQSNGYIRAHSRSGEGSTFEIYLPRSDEESKRETKDLAVKTSRGTETVLLVEDEDLVRQVLSRSLANAGYQVIEAASGEEAIRLYDAQQEPIHLLLTDVLMPGINGRELAEHLRRCDEDIKVILISGYAEGAIASTDLHDSDFAFLQKPFKAKTLVHTVRNMLDN